MKSAVVFIGVLLIIMSLCATNISHELKLLGFKEESIDLFQFSMFLSLIGFLLYMAAYPRIPQFHPIVTSLL